MRTRPASWTERIRWARGSWALAAAVVLATACTGAVPSPTPPVAAPSPAPSGAAATSPTVPSTSPHPTATPAPVVAHWDTLGMVGAGEIMKVTGVRLAGDRVLFLADAWRNETWGPYAAVWDPSTGRTREVAPLGKEREEYVAVALNDGRALVTGGTNDLSQSYSSTYLFDEAGDGTWTRSGLLHQARSAPCAAVLPDGRVLVAGGYFHVKPDWGAVESDARLAIAVPGRASSGPPVVADVEPPFAGAALATAELFDPGTGTWSQTGAMRFARSGCQAVTLRDGRVLVVGSVGTEGAVTVDGRAFASAEIYDPATGRFSLAGSLPSVDAGTYPRLHEEEDSAQIGSVGSLAAIDGGAVLIARTSWWKHYGDMTRSFRFDAATRTWTEIGKTFGILGYTDQAASSRFLTKGVRNLAGAQVATLPDGRVLVAGGRSAISSTSETSHVVSSVLSFDPTSDRWADLVSMPSVRQGGAVVVMADGTIVIAGGENDDTWTPSIVRFTPGR
jgi:hypothetical protein